MIVMWCIVPSCFRLLLLLLLSLRAMLNPQGVILCSAWLVRGFRLANSLSPVFLTLCACFG